MVIHGYLTTLASNGMTKEGEKKKTIAAYQSYDPGLKVRPRAGLDGGGGGASSVRLPAAPNLLARGPTMDPVHVAALAVEPQGMSRFGDPTLRPQMIPENGPVNPHRSPSNPQGTRVVGSPCPAQHSNALASQRPSRGAPNRFGLDMTRCQPIEVGSLPAEIREPILTCRVFSQHIWAKN